MASFWDQFEHDPRAGENAHLRAADRDRDVVHELLSNAYAEGRLTRDEFDERTDQVNQVRALGDLSAAVSDLVSTSSVQRRTASELRVEAEQRYRKDLREAFFGALTPSLICWVIWAWVLVGGDGTPFPWPIFVTVGTGIRFVKMVTDKQGSIEAITKRLEKKQIRELERGRREVD